MQLLEKAIEDVRRGYGISIEEFAHWVKLVFQRWQELKSQKRWSTPGSRKTEEHKRKVRNACAARFYQKHKQPTPTKEINTDENSNNLIPPPTHGVLDTDVDRGRTKEQAD